MVTSLQTLLRRGNVPSATALRQTRHFDSVRQYRRCNHGSRNAVHRVSSWLWERPSFQTKLQFAGCDRFVAHHVAATDAIALPDLIVTPLLARSNWTRSGRYRPAFHRSTAGPRPALRLPAPSRVAFSCFAAWLRILCESSPSWWQP